MLGTVTSAFQVLAQGRLCLVLLYIVASLSLASILNHGLKERAWDFCGLTSLVTHCLTFLIPLTKDLTEELKEGRKEGFILASSLRIQSMVEGRCGAESILYLWGGSPRQLLTPDPIRKQREPDAGTQLADSFPSFIPCGTFSTHME